MPIASVFRHEGIAEPYAVEMGLLVIDMFRLQRGTR